MFFAPILGRQFFSCNASAVALSNPRDIVFVVDLSGSMNNDTEPAWATGEINNEFGADYPDIGGELMQKVFDDFGYGAFPGTLEWVGAPLNVVADEYAYAEMTKTGGPLSLSTVASTYKIRTGDSEATRKTKAYKWMIDKQIAVVMPGVQPAAVSSNSTSLAYWTKYLDYVIKPQQIKSTSTKGKPRPSLPYTVPPSQSSNRITGFANPYQDAFPDADTTVAGTFCNKIGYRTYVQFMMDFGRDGKPSTGQLVPLSWNSPLCPKHDEETDGGPFRFPPRNSPPTRPGGRSSPRCR